MSSAGIRLAVLFTAYALDFTVCAMIRINSFIVILYYQQNSYSYKEFNIVKISINNKSNEFNGESSYDVGKRYLDNGI